MAISFRRYVDIVSGVGAGAGVRLRDLIGRFFTTSLRLPPASFIEFTDAAGVGAYFGLTSAEYLRAVFYFGFISKLIANPKKLSFASYVDTARAPRVYGTAAHSTLAQLKAIVAGALDITMGASQTNLVGINFSAAVDLAGVAAILQTAIRAYAAGGTNFTGATVTFDVPTNSFLLVGGTPGAAAMVLNPATGASIVNAMGWAAPSAIIAAGADVQTPLAAFTASYLANDNFGSFTFIPTLAIADWTAIAQANAALNVKFLATIPVPDVATGLTWSAALLNIQGAALTLSPLPAEYPEVLPMMIMAATDYNKRNSVQNYMFQQSVLTPSVVDNAVADQCDNARINYYGRTQTAGQNIDFYQRGTMCGLAVNPVDMNVYANEMWFKNLVGSTIMSLLLSLARVSANATGRTQLIATIMSVISEAIRNGTISIGKPFTIVQKLYIGQMTGDDLAWYQVQNIGYWLDCQMVSYVTTDGRTEWKAVYTLIYSKDDAIRKVEGSHVLI
jgi:hypothetical protein